MKIANTDMKVADGTYLLGPFMNMNHEKICKVNHTPDVSCKKAKIIQRTGLRNLVCLPDRFRSALNLSGRTFVCFCVPAF